MRNKVESFFVGCFVGVAMLATTLMVQKFFDNESIQVGDVVYANDEKFLVLKHLQDGRLLTAPIDTFVLKVEERGSNVNKLEYQ